MIELRRAAERGHADHGWLRSFHSFSFADYHDPAHMGFGPLRVINEDRVQPGMGFGTHGHRDMEIVSYVLDGALEHKDSMGNGSVIRAGDVQRMSAGTGVEHSEFNPSATETVHLYQIWLFPDERGHTPSYEDRSFDPAEKQDRLRLVASQDGRADSLTIHQHADIYLANLSAGKEVSHELRPERHARLQVLRGNVRVVADDSSATELGAGDAAAISEQRMLSTLLRSIRPK